VYNRRPPRAADVRHAQIACYVLKQEKKIAFCRQPAADLPPASLQHQPGSRLRPLSAFPDSARITCRVQPRFSPGVSRTPSCCRMFFGEWAAVWPYCSPSVPALPSKRVRISGEFAFSANRARSRGCPFFLRTRFVSRTPELKFEPERPGEVLPDQRLDRSSSSCAAAFPRRASRLIAAHADPRSSPRGPPPLASWDG